MHDVEVLFSRVRRGMLFTAVLGAGTALPGCGGGGGDAPAAGTGQSPSPSPSPSHAPSPAPPPAPVPAPPPLQVASTLSLVAGTTDPSSLAQGPVDGTGPGVRFMLAGGIAADGLGNVFVADTGASTIRQISASGEVSTLAGTPIATASANQFFTTFNQPAGMAIDGSGNLYVTDGFTNPFHVNRHWTSVRKVTPQGEATAFPLPTFTPGIPRLILGPGIAVDGPGNVYLNFGGAIRKLTPAGVMTNVTAPEVTRYISSLAVDKAGNVYFGYQNTVRKIVPGHAEVVLAGSGVAGYTDGAGVQASFDFPEYKLVGAFSDLYLTSLVVDSIGNVYVADSNNFAVRRITPEGQVTTVAGRPGVQRIQLGELPAGLATPRGLALDGDKTLYVSTATAVLRIDLR